MPTTKPQFRIVCDQGYGKSFSEVYDTEVEAFESYDSFQKRFSYGTFRIQKEVGTNVELVHGSWGVE